jgi:hypothetical protein
MGAWLYILNMKVYEKEQAIKLRASGLPLSDIAKKLNVAKSSVSVWCRDIILTDEQKEKLLSRNSIYNNQCLGAKKMKEIYRKKRLDYQNQGRLMAKENNPLLIAGCMLYWGEGFKSKTSCGLANTDPNLLKYFIKFLTNCFDVEKKDLTLRINCHTNNGLLVSEIEEYWVNVLNVPHSCLRKTTVNKVSSYSQRKKSKKQTYLWNLCSCYS